MKIGEETWTPLSYASKQAQALPPKAHLCEVALEWRNLGWTRACSNCPWAIAGRLEGPTTYSPAFQKLRVARACWPPAAGCCCCGCCAWGVTCGVTFFDEALLMFGLAAPAAFSSSLLSSSTTATATAPFSFLVDISKGLRWVGGCLLILTDTAFWHERA